MSTITLVIQNFFSQREPEVAVFSNSDAAHKRALEIREWVETGTGKKVPDMWIHKDENGLRDGGFRTSHMEVTVRSAEVK